MKYWPLLLLLACSVLNAAPRVITLAPNLTELAFAAGITPVAVSAFSDYPVQASHIEQVANWRGVNIERIIALKPDVILAWRGGSPVRQLTQLAHLGIKVEWVEPKTLDDIISQVRALARFSPAPAVAQQNADKLVRELAELRARYAHPLRQRVFLQYGLRPLFTASGHTIQNEVLSLCGGDNIFAASPIPWPQVSREQVLVRMPQRIITSGDNEWQKKVRNFWYPQLTAPVILLNEAWLSRPGPRILLAARDLCQQLQSDRSPQ